MGLLSKVLMSSSAGLYPKMGNGTTKRRRKKSAVKSVKRRKIRVVKKAGKKRARLVKGSRAAKAYMAKIRRKRR
jgi:hypothetical protein